MDSKTALYFFCVLFEVFMVISVRLAYADFPHNVPNSSVYDWSKCGTNATNTARGFVVDGNTKHKIMGGRDAKPGEVPWAVSIFRDNSYICSGSLVSTKHVITASHCLFKVDAPKERNCRSDSHVAVKDMLTTYTVRYGSHVMSDLKTLRIKSAEFMRFFNEKCLRSDMALIELSEEIDSKLANYVCLPHRNGLPPLNTITDSRIYGWGSNPESGEDLMQVLQVLSFSKLMDRATCSHFWKFVTEDAVCSAEVNMKNACLGDSGGGLMVMNSDNQWVLIGVVSFGTDCFDMLSGATSRAQIYTRTAVYSADVDRFTAHPFPWVQL